MPDSDRSPQPTHVIECQFALATTLQGFHRWYSHITEFQHPGNRHISLPPGTVVYVENILEKEPARISDFTYQVSLSVIQKESGPDTWMPKADKTTSIDSSVSFKCEPFPGETLASHQRIHTTASCEGTLLLDWFKDFLKVIERDWGKISDYDCIIKVLVENNDFDQMVALNREHEALYGEPMQVSFSRFGYSKRYMTIQEMIKTDFGFVHAVPETAVPPVLSSDVTDDRYVLYPDLSTEPWNQIPDEIGIDKLLSYGTKVTLIKVFPQH
jgi:hypothetical protein